MLPTTMDLQLKSALSAPGRCSYPTYSSNQSIAETRLGDETIFLVLAGQIDVVLEQTHLLTMKAGQFVDMLDLWDEYGSGATIRAGTFCEYVTVDNGLAERLEQHPPEFIVQIVRRLKTITQCFP